MNYCNEKSSITGNQVLLAAVKPKQGLHVTREGFPQALCLNWFWKDFIPPLVLHAELCFPFLSDLSIPLQSTSQR